MSEFINWTEERLSILWSRAEDSVANDEDSLALIRIIFGIYILLRWNPNFSWIGGIPQSFFLPPKLSFVNLLHDFPSSSFFQGLDMMLLLSGAGLLLGVRARYSGLLHSALLITGYSFKYSLGKIDHNIILPVFVVGLSFTN